MASSQRSWRSILLECSLYSFGALLILRVVVELVTSLQASQAVLPEEFEPLALGVQYLPALTTAKWVIVVLLALCLCVLVRILKIPFFLKVVLASAVPGLFWFSPQSAGFILPLASFCVVYLWTRAERPLPVIHPTVAMTLRHLGTRDEQLGLLDLLVFTCVSAGVLCMAEAFFYTRTFSGAFFSVADFHVFLAFALGNAAHYAAHVAILIWLMVAGTIAALKLAHKTGKLSDHSILLGLAFVLSAWGGLCGAQLLMSVLINEVIALGYLPMLLVVLASATLLGLMSTYKNLQNLLEAGVHPRSFRDLLGLLATAAVSPGLSPIRALWRAIRLPGGGSPIFAFYYGLALLAALGAVMALANYPTLHDYSTVALRIYSTLIILIGIGALFISTNSFLLRGRHLPARLSLGCLILFAGIGLWGRAIAQSTPSVKIVGNEYAVINKVFLQQKNWNNMLMYDEPRATRAHSLLLAFHPEEHPLYSDIPATFSPPDTPPVVVILMDALRPDRLGCYGGKRNLTPNIDAFAETATVFERAYSASTATGCATRALFTGRYSSRFMLEPDLPPYFTEDLAAHGYSRFLITSWQSNFNAVCIRNFQTGERRLPAVFEPLNPGQPHDMAECLKTSIPALQEAAQVEPGNRRGWLAYIHLVATHFPWKKRPYGKWFGDSLENLYDHNVNYSDIVFGDILDTLRKTGVYDSAIILLLADHGTGLNDHGRYAGFLPYEEQIRIPLIIKYPGVAPRRISDPVSIIDIAPTLLHAFEAGKPNRFDGISLLPSMLEGKPAVRSTLFNVCAFEDAYSVIYEGRWKYTLHRWEEYEQLYDLQTDPLERTDLLAENKDMAGRLRELTAAFLWHGRDSYDNPWHFKRPRHWKKDAPDTIKTSGTNKSPRSD